MLPAHQRRRNPPAWTTEYHQMKVGDCKAPKKQEDVNNPQIQQMYRTVIGCSLFEELKDQKCEYWKLMKANKDEQMIAFFTPKATAFDADLDNTYGLSKCNDEEYNDACEGLNFMQKHGCTQRQIAGTKKALNQQKTLVARNAMIAKGVATTNLVKELSEEALEKDAEIARLKNQLDVVKAEVNQVKAEAANHNVQEESKGGVVAFDHRGKDKKDQMKVLMHIASDFELQKVANPGSQLTLNASLFWQRLYGKVSKHQQLFI